MCIRDSGRQRNKSLSPNDPRVTSSTEEDGDISLGDNGKDDGPTKNINDEIGIPNETPSINISNPQQNTEQVQEEAETLSIPITEQDYEQDIEFRAVHSYKSTGELSGDEKQDKITLLVEEQYLIHEGILFKLVLPRLLRPITERLCIPLKFRRALIQHYHDKLSHPGTQRLFLTLVHKAYWKSLYADVQEYVTTCDTCARSKPNYAFRSVPLNPLTVPDKPFDIWHLDHKSLTRKTKEGNVAPLLVIIDAFSNWPIIVPVADITAAVTAKMFFKFVVTNYGVPLGIRTDRGSAYSSQFFTALAKLLNIDHRMSASRAPRSNGLAEALVKRVSQMIKTFDTVDTDIEDHIPLLEMALRAICHSRTQLSPCLLYTSPSPRD